MADPTSQVRPPSGFVAANLGLRFVLELGALAGLAYAGVRLADGTVAAVGDDVTTVAGSSALTMTCADIFPRDLPPRRPGRSDARRARRGRRAQFIRFVGPRMKAAMGSFVSSRADVDDFRKGANRRTPCGAAAVFLPVKFALASLSWLST